MVTSGGQPLCLALVDAQTLMREALRELLHRSGKVVVLGEARTAAQGYHLALDPRCQVLLLGLDLPDEPGLELIGRVRRVRSDLGLLVFSMHETADVVLQCLDRGASGYLPKNSTSDDLFQALQHVSEGRTYLHSRLALSVLTQMRARSSAVHSGPGLNERELAILRRVKAGLSTARIGDDLGMATSTVKACLSGVYRKLRVTDRTQAILMAIQSGLL